MSKRVLQKIQNVDVDMDVVHREILLDSILFPDWLSKACSSLPAAQKTHIRKILEAAALGMPAKACALYAGLQYAEYRKLLHSIKGLHRHVGLLRKNYMSFLTVSSLSYGIVTNPRIALDYYKAVNYKDSSGGTDIAVNGQYKYVISFVDAI